MGQWFEADMGPEARELLDQTIGNLPYDGKCSICGRSSFMKGEDITPEMMFDCLSEELEITAAISEESVSDGLLLMN